MILCNPDALAALLKPGQKLAGLDVGERTVGIAVSDPGRMIASARTTIRRARRFRDTAKLVLDALEGDLLGGIIVGLPINMRGDEGPRAQSSRQFAENLAGYVDVPITFWDERMSTAAVTRTLLEADVSRKRRQEVVDKMAAAFILQGCLDYLANVASRPDQA